MKNLLNAKQIKIELALVLVLVLTTAHCTHAFRDTIETYDDQVEVFDDSLLMEQQTNPEPAKISCIFEREGSQTCDCGYSDEDMVLPTLAGRIFQVQLSNCKRLIIPENSFSSLPHITWVRFNNIEELVLDERSLAFSSGLQNRVHLEFINTVIEEIKSHSISGNIEQIRIDNSKIGIIYPFAVTSLRSSMRLFTITGSSITRIEPQAFKKFITTEFEILNTTFGTDLPTRSFYEIEVTENLRIQNCEFLKVHSSALSFLEVSMFTMTNNIFEQFNGEAIRMQVRDSINIRNNDFGLVSPIAFQQITLDNNFFSRNSESMSFNFVSNYVDVMGGPQPLEFNNRFNMRIAQLYCKTALTCEKVEQLRENAFISENADTIYFRMDDEMQSTKTQEAEYYTFSYITNHRCIESTYFIYIIIGAVILVVLLVLLLSIIICLCVRRRRARKMNVIMPEAKTYRETQIVMQVENHGLLKTDL